MKALMGHPLDAAFGADTLRGADSRIVVTNVSQEIRTQNTYAENSGRDGRRLRQARREVIRITISFKLWEFSSVPDREAAVEAANAWARDGYLTLTSKPGRRILVQCAGRAASQNPRNYKEEYQLIFETAQSPFWEQEAPTLFSLSGASDTENVQMPGTYESAFDAVVSHDSGTLDTLTLRAGDTYFYFSSLGLAAGTDLVISHDGAGRLTIQTGGGVSKYACRLAASDDELMGGPGLTTLGLVANVSCSATFSARARYR